LQALGVLAEHVVFVDDQLRNVAGAQRCGLPVVHLDVCQPGGGFAKAMQMLAAL
jgi:putative hydrolase of the HAD superfamily